MDKTWYCGDTASLDVTDGTDFNEDLEDAIPTQADHSKGNVSGGDSDVVTHTYTNLDNVPNLTEWPSGDYIGKINCTVIGADVSYKIAICRIDSAGALVSTLGTSGVRSTTGLFSFTHNLASPLTVNAGDRLQIRTLVSRLANHGNQVFTVQIGTGGSESRLETPIVLAEGAAKIHPHVINTSAMI